MNTFLRGRGRCSRFFISRLRLTASTDFLFFFFQSVSFIPRKSLSPHHEIRHLIWIGRELFLYNLTMQAYASISCISIFHSIK